LDITYKHVGDCDRAAWPIADRPNGLVDCNASFGSTVSSEIHSHFNCYSPLVTGPIEDYIPDNAPCFAVLQWGIQRRIRKALGRERSWQVKNNAHAS
jgi:hypothetical protein